MRPKKPARRSMSSLRRPGRKSLSCTAPCFRPEPSARRAISTASFRLVAIGFSQYTCLPARMALASSVGRICVVPASKKMVSSGVLQRLVEVGAPARDVVRLGQRFHLLGVAADEDRVGHDLVAVGQRHAALRADRADRADQVLVHAHAAGDAVHDDS
jgi:hypothetical protein